MHPWLTRRPGGFPPGLSAVTEIGEPCDTGIRFAVLRLAAGEGFEGGISDLETASLLLSGEAVLHLGGRAFHARRSSPFDDAPACLHTSARDPVTGIEAVEDCEIALFGVRNEAAFEPAFFDGASLLEREQRGQGRWDDCAWREVRTILDTRNRPEANLVLGEVLNQAGRWSSYPPHHHPQPEIYHYRFERPQGYGFCQLGDEVLKVRDGDTVRILDGRDHPQVAAPGYRMYYAWAIRHLPGRRYAVPEFAAEHRWLME